MSAPLRHILHFLLPLLNHMSAQAQSLFTSPDRHFPLFYPPSEPLPPQLYLPNTLFVDSPAPLCSPTLSLKIRQQNEFEKKSFSEAKLSGSQPCGVFTVLSPGLACALTETVNCKTQSNYLSHIMKSQRGNVHSLRSSGGVKSDWISVEIQDLSFCFWQQQQQQQKNNQ